MLLPGAIFELRIHQNAFAGGALPRTPSAPQIAGFQGPLGGRGGERKGKGGEG